MKKSIFIWVFLCTFFSLGMSFHGKAQPSSQKTFSSMIFHIGDFGDYKFIDDQGDFDYRGSIQDGKKLTLNHAKWVAENCNFCEVFILKHKVTSGGLFGMNRYLSLFATYYSRINGELKIVSEKKINKIKLKKETSFRLKPKSFQSFYDNHSLSDSYQKRTRRAYIYYGHGFFPHPKTKQTIFYLQKLSRFVGSFAKHFPIDIAYFDSCYSASMPYILNELSKGVRSMITTPINMHQGPVNYSLLLEMNHVHKDYFDRWKSDFLDSITQSKKKVGSQSPLQLTLYSRQTLQKAISMIKQTVPQALTPLDQHDLDYLNKASNPFTPTEHIRPCSFIYPEKWPDTFYKWFQQRKSVPSNRSNDHPSRISTAFTCFTS